MLESTNALIAATLAFVGGHFLLSSRPIRPFLIERYGEGSFRMIYSGAMTVALIWMVAAFRSAPFVPLWHPPLALAWVPLLVMPLATILVVAGLTSPNPTLVGAQFLLNARLFRRFDQCRFVWDDRFSPIAVCGPGTTKRFQIPDFDGAAGETR